MSGQATIAAAVGRYLRRAAEEAPLLLVIEDLHFATATTRATVRHIARSPIHAPILMLITTRDTAPDVDDELRVLLGDLARMPAVDNIDLGGLPAAEVADLLARLGSTADATTVTNETGGNPLLVVEVARSRGGTPASLHAMLARRYALVTDADLTVLDVASVVGTEFDPTSSLAAWAAISRPRWRASSASRQPVSSTPCRVDRDSSRSPMRCSGAPATTTFPHTHAW